MNRHSLDSLSLGAGLSFLAIAAAFVIGEFANISINGAVVFPLLLVVLGVLGVYAAVRAQQHNDIEVEAASLHSDLRQQ